MQWNRIRNSSTGIQFICLVRMLLPFRHVRLTNTLTNTAITHHACTLWSEENSMFRWHKITISNDVNETKCFCVCTIGEHFRQTLYFTTPQLQPVRNLSYINFKEQRPALLLTLPWLSDLPNVLWSRQQSIPAFWLNSYVEFAKLKCAHQMVTMKLITIMLYVSFEAAGRTTISLERQRAEQINKAIDRNNEM